MEQEDKKLELLEEIKKKIEENKKNGSSVKAVGLCDMLTVAFVVLKLLGKINWSWWWVLAPTWIPLAIVLGLLIVALIIAVIAAAID